MEAKEILNKIKSNANYDLVEKRKKKFGIQANQALGLTQKQLNEIIKGVRKNETLALALFESDIHEARLLCSKLYPPKMLTKNQAEEFVKQLENWEICDTYSMKLFAHSTLAEELIYNWSHREAEFEKRAAFATLAGLTLADKKSDNKAFTHYFKIIYEAASDERLYVKKAVNWALRSLGKRNQELKEEAIEVAKKLLLLDSKSAQWDAKNTLSELENPKTRIADYPRNLYRLH
ncbi:MAG: DNA alkylation repair protein [Vicingaceae bacterium]